MREEIKVNIPKSNVVKLERLLGLQKVEVSRISRQLANEGGKDVSFMHRSPFLPRYSCMFAAESTPEPLCGRKHYVNEKSQ
jgi:hypothetical protein